MKKVNCKFCGKETKNHKGYCVTCYQYFITENKKVYDLPPYGEMRFNKEGDCICPFCGKAFRKLGGHFWQSHNLTSIQAHKKAGWDVGAKASNIEYRKTMRNKLVENSVKINLIERGKKTRFKKGSEGRTKLKVSAMTMKRLKQKSFIKAKIKENYEV